MTKNYNLRTKSSAILNIVSNHVTYYPTPSNLNNLWAFGSLIGIFLVIQIITGIFLAMYYIPFATTAFESISDIMIKVKAGYIFRYAHANGASMIFIFLYLHIARGLYTESYSTRPYLWCTGLIIFLLMMGTAFIGYVLPWGQMSFWGASVITGLLTAIPFVGQDMVVWIWGGFTIQSVTLTRFFSIHYILPIIIVGLVVLHLLLLHDKGSSTIINTNISISKITFHPYFVYKDAAILSFALVIFIFLVFFQPNFLGHTDNWIEANPLVTPAHIVPEWYFTPFYAILRACPDRVGGILGMLFSIIILFFLPITSWFIPAHLKNVQTSSSYIHQIIFILFCITFSILLFYGSNPATHFNVILSRHFAVLYFIICTTFFFIAWIPESSNHKTC